MISDPNRLLSRYRSFTSTIVSDALDEHDVGGVLTGLTPAHPDHRAIGVAKPVQLEPASPDVDRTNFPFDLFEAFETDRVFVMNSISSSISCWGGLASRLAEKAGMQGSIISGGFRDYDEIREGTYPVFGVSPTPRSGQPRLRIASIGESVGIQDVAVSDGDIVVADGTGVAIVPSGYAAAVAETAEDLLAKELVLDRKVANGMPVDALTSDYEGF